MSSFINLLSDGCVNFEKCGDVVVSTKDNMIGLFCHFCCDIFKSLPEFMHHLQYVHNDVLAFTKEYNVYTVEELMALTDRSPEQLQVMESQDNCSNSSSDSGVPGDATSATSFECIKSKQCPAEDSTCLSKSKNFEESVILVPSKQQQNDLLCHDIKLQQILQPAGQQDIKLPKEQLSPIEDKHDVVNKRTHTQINPTVCKIDNPVKQLQMTYSKRSNRIQEVGSKNKSTKKMQPLCNLKSYAITRFARKREQQQRLGNIKKRIFRSLENDATILNCQPFKNHEHYDLQKLLANNQHSTKHKIPETKSEEKIKQIDYNDNENASAMEALKMAVDTLSNDDDFNSLQSEKISEYDSLTNIRHKISSPIIITKIEYLPKLDYKVDNSQKAKISSQFNKDHEVMQMEEPAKEKQMPRRRSSVTVVSSPDMVVKMPTRRPSYSAANSCQTQLQTVNSELNSSLKFSNKRKLDTKTSSIKSDEAKRTKSEDNFTCCITDSLLRLADPQRILKQVVNEGVTSEKKFSKAATNDSSKIKTNMSIKTYVRDDLTLLQLVGLPIIKDANIEDRKPVEYSEALRSVAAKFSKMFKEHEYIWNPKKFDSQFTHKIRQELAELTKEANDELKADLNISELKRILNLINAWHVQRINQKFFKKVTLSSTIEHYLLLFGFLPKIYRCRYYCEWCDETSANKSSYEKHRLLHPGNFFGPHCKRIFKKQSYLINHVRNIHGKED